MTTTFGHAFQAVGPGPGPKNSGPGPEVRVWGPQKVPGPDLDRTLDSLTNTLKKMASESSFSRSSRLETTALTF